MPLPLYAKHWPSASSCAWVTHGFIRISHSTLMIVG